VGEVIGGLAPVRVGMVGWGHAAKLQKCAIDAHPRFVLAAVCQPAAGKVANGLSFVSLADLVREDICDIVSLCTPPRTHGDLVTELLNAGKPVLIEKPVTVDRMSFAELKARLTGSQLFAYSALHAAFGREVLWACRQLESFGRIPRVIHFDCEFTDPYLLETGAVKSDAISLGDPWTDSAINALSLVSRFTDLASWKVLTFEGEKSRLTWSARAALKAVDGATGNVVTLWTPGPSQKKSRFLFDSGLILELDHMAQSGRIEHGGRTTKLSSDSAPRERLLEHYLGVLDDLDRHWRARSSNIDAAEAAHLLVFDGMEAMRS
jgi:predicted dehydrogenase